MLINCLTTACLFSCCAKRPQHAELLRTDGQWPGGGTEEQRWAQGEWMLCELLATACAERATRQQPNPTGKFHLPSAVSWAYRTRPRESWPLTAPLSLESSVQSLLKPQGCPQDKDLRDLPNQGAESFPAVVVADPQDDGREGQPSTPRRKTDRPGTSGASREPEGAPINGSCLHCMRRPSSNSPALSSPLPHSEGHVHLFLGLGQGTVTGSSSPGWGSSGVGGGVHTAGRRLNSGWRVCWGRGQGHEI